MDLNRLEDIRTLSPSQQAATDISDNKVVNAGAGSGKTRVLTARYLKLLADGLMPENIIAITFTKKAAREMQERISAAIDKLMIDCVDEKELRRLRQIRESLPAANIGTIHSFYAQLLRQYPLESEVDPAFSVLDELDAGLLLGKAGKQLYRRCLAEQCPDFNLLAEVLGAGAVEEGGTLFSSLLSLYRTLANRGQSVSDLDLSTGYSELPSWSKLKQQFCWHAEGAAVIAQSLSGKDKPEYIQGRQMITELAASLQTVNEPQELIALVPQMLAIFDLGKPRVKVQKEFVQEAMGHMQDLLSAGLTPILGRAIIRLLNRLEAAYEQQKAARCALDFADLQFRVRDLLRSHPAVAAELDEKYQAYLVDEFQDTDRLQKEIVYLLLKQGERIPPGKLFVVGDEKQSIYRFRGAEVKVFDEVRKDLVAINPEREVSININYRSRKHLIELVNTVFSHLLADNSEVRYIPLEAFRGGEDGCAELILCEQQEGEGRGESEARLLAARIQSMVMGAEKLVVSNQGLRPVEYRDIAILIRARTHLKEYEYQLRQAGIPYSVVGGVGFYQRQEVEDLLNLLAVVNNLRDELALVGVLRSPLFAINDDSLTELALAKAQAGGCLLDHGEALTEGRQQELLARARRIITELRGCKDRLGVAELITFALDSTGYRETILAQFAGVQRLANVNKLLSVAEDFQSRGNYSLSDFLLWVEEADKAEPEAPITTDAANVVRIMTVHASKGLQFPVVFLPLVSSAVPRNKSWLLSDCTGKLALKFQWQCRVWEAVHAEEAFAQREEFKRLLYVAMTRAEDYLVFIGAPVEKPEDSLNYWLQSSLSEGVDLLKEIGQQLEVRPLDACAAPAFPKPNARSDVREHFPGLRPVGGGKRTYRHHNISQFLLWKHDREQFDKMYFTRWLEADTADVRRQQVLEWQHEPGGPAFGSFLHRALELIDTEIDCRKLLAELIPHYFPEINSAQYRQILQAAVELLAAYSEEEFAGQFVESQRELRFFLRHNSALFTGIIDRVFIRPDRIAVVDYKTNRIPTDGVQSLVEYYRPQLLFYAQAAGELYQRPVEAWLHFLRLPREQQLQPVAVEADGIKNLQSELTAFLKYCIGPQK
ncbi:MAG: hypothetical protein FH749_00785 [Firmicutes bacterium]|nr:hypothetical protein [Bacillota bacterium]